MRRNQKGQGVLEYLILVALVALVCVGGMKALGGKLHRKITEVREKIDSGIPVRLSPRDSNDSGEPSGLPL